MTHFSSPVSTRQSSRALPPMTRPLMTRELRSVNLQMLPTPLLHHIFSFLKLREVAANLNCLNKSFKAVVGSQLSCKVIRIVKFIKQIAAEEAVQPVAQRLLAQAAEGDRLLKPQTQAVEDDGGLLPLAEMMDAPKPKSIGEFLLGLDYEVASILSALETTTLGLQADAQARQITKRTLNPPEGYGQIFRVARLFRMAMQCVQSKNIEMAGNAVARMVEIGELNLAVQFSTKTPEYSNNLISRIAVFILSKEASVDAIQRTVGKVQNPFQRAEVHKSITGQFLLSGVRASAVRFACQADGESVKIDALAQVIPHLDQSLAGARQVNRAIESIKNLEARSVLLRLFANKLAEVVPGDLVEAVVRAAIERIPLPARRNNLVQSHADSARISVSRILRDRGLIDAARQIVGDVENSRARKRLRLPD